MPAVRSKHHSSSGQPTRTRSSVACQNCRQRKIKCDTQDLETGQPCTPCAQSNLECVVDRNSDRRKLTARKQTESLQQRIRELEALIERNATTAVRDVAVQNVEIAGKDHTDITLNIALNGNSHDSASVACPSESFEESIRSRVGVGDGAAVFGLTTSAHVWLPEEEAPEHNLEFFDNSSEDLQIPGVRVDMHAVQLRNHLLQIYFKYQRLWINVVHKGVFMEHRAKNVASQWYSKFLEDVLLASASRISTSSAVRALGNEYAKEAKAGIMEALEHPSAASLQGFILLSEYEVTLGHDRIGWMLSGMACRMIFDLGLHRKMKPPHSTMDENSIPTEANLYFSLLCAVISYEGSWCMYLGRPSSIQKSVIDATSELCKSSQSPHFKVAVAWVGLSELTAQINDLINNSFLSMASASNRLQQLGEELQHWQDSLPPGLRYSDSGIENLESEAYGLQMQYCKIRILLHQAPILSCTARKRKLGQPDLAEPQEAVLQKELRGIIYMYALQAAKILLTYRQLFGTDKISSIMLDTANIAATTLISHLLTQPSPDNEDANIKQWLRSIVSTLNAVQTHFPITKRMVQTLKKMVVNTILSDVFAGSSSSSSPFSITDKYSPPRIFHENNNPNGNLSNVTPSPFTFRPDQLVKENQVPFERPCREWCSEEQRVDLIDSQRAWFEDNSSDLAASIMSWPTSEYLSNLLLDPLNE